MKSKLVIFISLFLSLVLISSSAEARRFGGFSRSYSKSWSRSTKPKSYSTYISKNSSASYRSSRRGFFKGAFMGLLAGGLIGSLLSGHAFNGLGFIDYIFIMILAFFIMKAINRFRRPRSSSRDGHQ